MSHCNHNVQSQKWPGTALHCGVDLFVVTNSQFHLRRHYFVIPRFRTVAYGKRSLTYLGTVIWSILDISIRLSHWTLAKSVLNWLISQANWTALVKTFFYVTTKNWFYLWTRLSKKSFGFHRPPSSGQKRLAPLAKRSTCSTSTCGHTFHILLIIRLFYWLLDK